MKYRCVKQFDTTDCGSACIASIAWSFGKKISLSEVRELAETSKDGASVANICQAVDRIGLKNTMYCTCLPGGWFCTLYRLI